MAPGRGGSLAREPIGARPRCVACGDVIGVYEPLMHVIGAAARRTSLAADPDACSGDGDCYHAGCYERFVSGG